MRVAIVGLGAVGTFLAEKLAPRASRLVLGTRGRIPPSLAGDAPSHSIGVVRTDDATRDASPEAVDRIIVATKAYDLERAMEAARACFADPRHWVLVGNGLDLEEIAARVEPDRPVTRATVSYGLLREPDGRVRVTDGGECTVAGDPDLAGLFESAGLRVREIEDPFEALWTKGALNCGINPVASLSTLTNGDLIESPAFPVAVSAAEECAELAGRIGGRDLVPNSGSWRSELENLCRMTARNRCSMLRDLDLGRPTEIDHLNGYVARRAHEIGHPAPTNDTLARLVRARQSSSSGAPSSPDRR